jgi:hypothetical protein
LRNSGTVQSALDEGETGKRTPALTMRSSNSIDEQSDAFGDVH